MSEEKLVPSSSRPRAVQARIEKMRAQYSRGGDKRRERAEQLYSASQWQLMRAKFGKHKLAIISLYLLGFFYLIAILAEFVAPYDPLERSRQHLFAPPSQVHWFAPDGSFVGPYVLTSRTKVNPATFRYDLSVNDDMKANPIVLFPKVAPYKLAGLFPMDVKLFGTEGRQPFFLLGADNLGRDIFSRLVHASRISLFVGFGGVIISFVLGLTLGGISGYMGGKVNSFIQRTIELLMSIPQFRSGWRLPRRSRPTGPASRPTSPSRWSCHLSAGPVLPAWCGGASCQCVKKTMSWPPEFHRRARGRSSPGT